jgi:hypothetical protein
MQKNKLRLLVATALLLVPFGLNAQTQNVEMPADRNHAASGLHRTLFGSGYRDVWTVPIVVPVLNLDTYAGGLTAFQEGGNQSRTLRLRGANGKVYHFRSTKKFEPRNLPEDVKNTPAGDLIQDQSSAMHPTGHLLIAGLQGPAGVLQPTPQLVILPDHPRLGQFRKTFAGMMGQIEERPQDYDDNEKLNFAGAEKVQGADKLLENLEQSMEYYLDQRDWLRVRLIDFLVGDTDRGADQWEFARFDVGDRKAYKPIPRDRDYAFMNSDGLLIRMTSMVYPKLVVYGDRFAKLNAYLFMTREFDRSHLNALTWNDWQTVIKDVQTRLTDRVIDDAVMRLPSEHRQLSGPKLASGLRARRNNLELYARRYYDVINEEADIFGSEENDRADIERHTDGSVTVRIFRQGAGGDVAAGTNGYHTPAFERRFTPDETSEIRVYLDRGDDRAVVRGVTDYTIDVRVVGGEGNDILVDSTDVSRGGTYTTFYDAHGRNSFVTNRHTRVSRKPYVATQPIEPETEPGDEKKPSRVLQEERRGRFQDLMNTGGFIDSKTKAQNVRSWGQRVGLVPAVELREGSGVVLGAGYGMTDYGFRRVPFESRFVVTGMVSPTTGRLGAQLDWDWHPENSNVGLGLYARASQFEANRFFGWGNESPFDDVKESLVRRDEIMIHPNMSYRFDQGSFLSFGPVARRTNPHIYVGSVADTLFGSPLDEGNAALLGGEKLAQLGARLDFVYNTTNLTSMPRSGFVVRSNVIGFAPELDCQGLCAGNYYNATATVANYLSIGNSILALRVGGTKVFGDDDFPLHDAAFIGGMSTLRGYRWNRFAGDGAVFGGTELRVPLTRTVLFTRGDLGISALADAGRVWFEGDSDGGWHTGVGVGLWFHTLSQTISVSYAKGEDEGRFYFKLGPAF